MAEDVPTSQRKSRGLCETRQVAEVLVEYAPGYAQMTARMTGPEKRLSKSLRGAPNEQPVNG